MRIYVQSAGKGGVAFYRTVQPYTYISKNHEVFFNDTDLYDPQRSVQETEAADVIVMQMPFGEIYWREIQRNKKRKKPKLIIAEFDDNIFNIHPLNDSYRNFGQDIVKKYFTDISQARVEQEKFKRIGLERTINLYPKEQQFKIGNDLILGEIDLWVSGENGFDLEANRLRMGYTKMTIAEADIVTVSTEYLGKIIRKYRPDKPIAVLPNLIDLGRWLPMKPNESDEIRIFWSGGQAHFQDLYMVKRALEAILDKYPKVKLVIKGGRFENLFHVKHANRIEWIGWHSDIYTYPLDMRDARADIGICPVVDDRFNRSKSNLKWLEFSALKIPSVCSKTTYGGSVDYGKTGFIANNFDEWVNCLSKLIESKELRQEIAEKAYNRVKHRYSVEHSTMWSDLIRDYKLNSMKAIKLVK
jgi:glycosyltransferase involved in cell wall biosynthesis